MKTILKTISLLIVLSLGLFSCKTASLMKRHYNKGYYVSKKHDPAEIKASEKIVQTKTPESSVQKQFEETAKIKTPESKKDVALKNDERSEKIQTTKIATKENKQNQIANGFSGARHPFNNMVGMPKELKKAFTNQEPVRDALSLLWILILVLLIIYVIGLIFDLFGIGPIFHILGVIILVLLILWLLRVI